MEYGAYPRFTHSLAALHLGLGVPDDAHVHEVAHHSDHGSLDLVRLASREGVTPRAFVCTRGFQQILGQSIAQRNAAW